MIALSTAAVGAEKAISQLSLNLLDGSRLIGQTELESVSVTSRNMGRVAVPLGRIKSIKLGGSQHPTQITLQNGDQITGVIDLPEVVLQTAFGKVSVRLSLVKNWETLAASGQTGVNLIINGSFEDGLEIEGNGSRALDPGSEGIPGWTITRGQIDRCKGWGGADGNYALDLNGSPGIGGAAQKFATIPGRRYQVAFLMAGNPSNPRVTTMRVEAAGQAQEFSFNTAGKTFDDMGWVNKEWMFTAEAATTTLEFYSTDKQSPLVGPALDNVSVKLAAP